MPTARRALGQRGEELAATYLQTQGYRIIGRNYTCRYGEIDLLCTHRDTLVFCEVKLRRSERYGTPEEALTPRKLQRLTLAAQCYLVDQGSEDADWRLDLVAIALDRRGVVLRTTLYQGVGQ